MTKKSDSNGATILVVDDEAGIRFGLRRLFEREGFAVETAEDAREALDIAHAKPVDLAIVDIKLRNGKTGLDLLTDLKSAEPDIAVLIVTGYGSVDSAVQAMRQGAYDYITKPIDNLKLLGSVRKNLELRDLKRENQYLRGELAARNRSDRFITGDPEMLQILARADRIKNNAVTVLITGESGTGKEVLARYIHSTSNRSSGRFVGVNCAALSESLLLSELFGHERGAFTGAIERRLGRFEIADGGTLFLDEIGDMSLDVQAKLLRVIEESAFERVGGTRRISVDVRIIAATNKNLPELIRAGRFREDLFYRINIVSFQLPPLRARTGDIPLLVEHLVRKYAAKYTKKTPTPSAETLDLLSSYPWPGNVRELENIVNQAVLLSDGEALHLAVGGAAGASSIDPAGAPRETALPSSDDAAPRPEAGRPKPLKEADDELLGSFEKRYIADALRTNGYNKSKCARALGITRKTLARKIERYGIGRESGTHA